jgi:urate oxidase
LLGIDYNYNNADFSKGFTLQALYKYINSKEDFSFQLTGVWYMHMLEHKLTFSGFADFWKEENAFTTGPETTETTQFVFLSEPQLWYNVTSHFSAGGELELGSNFGGVKGFAANPTVALKWIF